MLLLTVRAVAIDSKVATKHNERIAKEIELREKLLREKLELLKKSTKKREDVNLMRG
jgi:LPS O-antigen subunit length determinant protein (WzzB/FepE family)